jgi:proteasome lid subunit RPN8/RPN11
MSNCPDNGDGKVQGGVNDLTVCLSKDLHDTLRDLAARQWPEECCGLLIASQQNPNRIDRVVVGRNVASDPRKTFEIDPQVLIDTYRAVRSSDEAVVGCFHSHPNGNVLPSTMDRARADTDGFLWLIIATDHSGVLQSGMYRAQHQIASNPQDADTIRYFRRCKLVSEITD